MSIPTPSVFLPPHGTIGVMAPSSYVERDDIEASKILLEDMGYNVFIHPQSFEREHQSAGNLLQKTLALQGLWMRDDIDVVWAAGGGNRGATLLETIAFDKIKNKVKPLIGFSDTTCLLNALYAHANVSCFHAPVFKQLHSHKNTKDILDLLAGKPSPMPMDGVHILREGEATGSLFGGCLSPFLLLPHSKDCPDLEGAILFLEDCGEEFSRIDRMFLHLRRMGVFEKISGLVLGRFHDLQDSGRPFGYTLKQMVEMHTDGFDFPIIMEAPFGHGDTLYPLQIGAKMRLCARRDELVFEPAA